MLTALLFTKRILSRFLPLSILFAPKAESEAYRNGRASHDTSPGAASNPYDPEIEPFSHDQWMLGRGERHAVK